MLFHARIAAERSASEGGFTVDDVADALAAKLIRRHPHVFGSVSVSWADDVSANWEEIKKAERAAAASEGSAPSVLDGVAFGQLALLLAAQVQRRPERAGIPLELGADGLEEQRADAAGSSGPCSRAGRPTSWNPPSTGGVGSRVSSENRLFHMQDFCA